VDVTDNDWASYMATYAGFAIGALYQWPSRGVMNDILSGLVVSIALGQFKTINHTAGAWLQAWEG
jgi:hypothetical protein